MIIHSESLIYFKMNILMNFSLFVFYYFSLINIFIKFNLLFNYTSVNLGSDQRKYNEMHDIPAAQVSSLYCGLSQGLLYFSQCVVAVAANSKIRQKRTWIIDSFSLEEESPGPFPYVLGVVSIVFHQVNLCMRNLCEQANWKFTQLHK